MLQVWASACELGAAHSRPARSQFGGDGDILWGRGDGRKAAGTSVEMCGLGTMGRFTSVRSENELKGLGLLLR